MKEILKHVFYLLAGIVLLACSLFYYQKIKSNRDDYIYRFLEQYGWSGTISADIQQVIIKEQFHFQSKIEEIKAAQQSMGLSLDTSFLYEDNVKVYWVYDITYGQYQFPRFGKCKYNIYIFADEKKHIVLSAFLEEANERITIYPLNLSPEEFSRLIINANTISQ